MSKTYIFGHHNPDTDSVCSAICLSYFKNRLGDNTEPRVLDELNEETKFVLSFFKAKKPKMLDNVKLQVKDIKYHKNYTLKDTNSIKDVYDFLSEKKITGIPIVNSEGQFEGLITLKIILNRLINGNLRYLNTSYDNLIKVLKGSKVLKYDNNITGNIIVGGYKSDVFVHEVKLSSDNILITSNRNRVIEYAINSDVKTIILVGDCVLDKEIITLAKKNKVNIISTPLDTFNTTMLINWANFAKSFCDEERIVCFNENDYYNDFIETSKRLKHNNYPVVNNKGKCLGLLRITDVDSFNRKNVILVDHNESSQSVTGLSQANILEIVDHHKIGDLTTSIPINFRNMAVGSTCTIIYQLYKEKKVRIIKPVAGLLLSGILSDTLILKSPTTTDIDKKAVKELSKICKLDYKKYGFLMFKEGSKITDKSIDDIIDTDLKIFEFEDLYKYAVSQVITLEIDEIFNNIDLYIEKIEQMKKTLHLSFLLVVVTDILKNGSYLIYTNGAEDVIKEGFNLKEIKQGVFIEKQVSRKKQIVPSLIKGINKLR